MSAILRASGETLDVDSFLSGSPLLINRVYRVGEPVFPASKPQGRKHTRSGFSVIASEVDFEDYKLQMKESFFFMRDHAEELRRLVGFTGIQSVCIDFGANIYPPGWCSFRFPHRLMKIAGDLRIDLMLSVYPCEPDEELEESEQCREKLEEGYTEFKAQQKSGENKSE